MNEDHIVIEDKDIEDSDAEVEEESEVNADNTVSVSFIVVIIHGESVSLVPAETQSITEEDKCEVEKSEHSEPADNFIEYTGETFAVFLAHVGDGGEEEEDESVEETACSEGEENLVEFPFCVGYVYFVPVGVKLGHWYTHYLQDNELPEIV